MAIRSIYPKTLTDIADAIRKKLVLSDDVKIKPPEFESYLSTDSDFDSYPDDQILAVISGRPKYDYEKECWIDDPTNMAGMFELRTIDPDIAVWPYVGYAVKNMADAYYACRCNFQSGPATGLAVENMNGSYMQTVWNMPIDFKIGPNVIDMSHYLQYCDIAITAEESHLLGTPVIGDNVLYANEAYNNVFVSREPGDVGNFNYNWDYVYNSMYFPNNLRCAFNLFAGFKAGKMYFNDIYIGSNLDDYINVDIRNCLWDIGENTNIYFGHSNFENTDDLRWHVDQLFANFYFPYNDEKGAYEVDISVINCDSSVAILNIEKTNSYTLKKEILQYRHKYYNDPERMSEYTYYKMKTTDGTDYTINVYELNKGGWELWQTLPVN